MRSRERAGGGAALSDVGAPKSGRSSGAGTGGSGAMKGPSSIRYVSAWAVATSGATTAAAMSGIGLGVGEAESGVAAWSAA